MPVKAFVSSTRADLDPDCRPAALEGVTDGGGQSIAMETWTVPHLDPVAICRRKLQDDSTHYVGVFAYRFGALVPGGTRSITQAEYALAHECKDRESIIAFIPDPKCEFAAQLLDRAKDQTPQEAQAQRAFLDDVRTSGAYTSFTASYDLYRRVRSMVQQWSQGSLRQTARTDAVTQPGETEICALARADQDRKFCDSLDLILSSDKPDVAAFVIHGKAGMGHRELASRLRATVERTSAGAMEYAASVSPMWRNDGLKSLLAVLGRGIKPGFAPASIQEYADALVEQLKTRTAVLAIYDVQRFTGKLSGFMELFWSPLATAIAARAKRPLVCLISLEETCPDLPAAVPPLTSAGLAQWNPAQVIRLKELEAFQDYELSAWLRRSGLDKETALAYAAAVMEETGGDPRLVYTKLRDPEFWNSI